MNPEEEKYDLIERYLEGRLLPKEAEEFRQRMEQDADLRQEVQAHQAVHDLVLDQGLIDLKQKLQTIHQNELRKNSDNGRWKLYSGIGALVVIGATALYLYNQPVATPETAVLPTAPQPAIAQTTDSTPIAALPEAEDNTAAPAPAAKSAQTNAPEEPVKGTTPAPVTASNTSTEPEKPKPAVTVSTPAVTTPTKQEPDNSTPPVSAAKDPADCSQVRFEGTVSGAESCIDSPTGTLMIQLSSLKGGQKPYKFSLSKEDGYKTAAHFDQLEAATYEVWVKDKNNCTGLLQKVEIKGKNCPKEYIFAPSREQVWEIPLKEGSPANDIRIFNRGGQMVYQASLLQVFQPVWHGTDNTGISVPMGSYSFVIRYTNGEVEQGYVTVLQ